MYYILPALMREHCGVSVMDRVAEISGGRVTVGPGTLCAVLARFEELDMIVRTRENGRQKWYLITQKGRQMLEEEHERIGRQMMDGSKILGE